MIRTKCTAVIFLSVTSFFLLQGCKKNEAAKESGDPSIQPRGESPIAREETSSYQVSPGVGIGPIQFGMSKEAVVAHLGQPEKIANGGVSLMYPSKGFTLTIYPGKGVLNINCYTKVTALPGSAVNDFPGETKEGIAMGSTRSNIIAGLGKPDKSTGGGRQVELNYDKLGIRFILLNDKLVQFFMSSP